MTVTGGPTTVHVTGPAGVWSTFRFALASTARTDRVCSPTSSVYSTLFSGRPAQSANSAPSREHSNVAFTSLLENVNPAGAASPTNSAGRDSIVVSGSFSSTTVH